MLRLACLSALLLGCGSTLQTPDGGGTGGTGGGGGPTAALACAVDDDCTVSAFDRPVSSVAGCYCVGCGTKAMNRTTATAHSDQWTQHCSNWQALASCPQYDCISPPPVRCIGGICAAGVLTTPQTCPQDPSSGCPQNAVRCGSACCGAGEWCDQTIGACRCGYGDGCDNVGGQQCATAGPVTVDSCGGYCCSASGVNCPQ